MATYYKINKEGKIENTILAEKNFIESQPDKNKYVRKITNLEEEINSQNDLSYVLNEPQPKFKLNRETREMVMLEEPIYNFKKRKFKNPQPFPSWSWDEESYEWIPPVPKPLVDILWDEENQRWNKYED